MSESLEELLGKLEQLTASILQQSSWTEAYDVNEVMGSVQQRAALVQQLSEWVRSNPTASYAEHNRLIIVHFQGEQIQQNLRSIRTGIAADLTSGSRNRLYADRIASQLPRVPLQG